MPASRIKTSSTGDYAHRIIINRSELDRVFEALKSTITYSNYKEEVARHADQAKHLHIYHRWWSDMASLQDRVGSGARISGTQWYRDTFDHASEPMRSALNDAEPPAPENVRGKRGNGRKPIRDDRRPLDL